MQPDWSPLFERFTERARQVVVLAQEEARTLKHDYIGTEHILLGLLGEKEGPAARALGSLDITVDRVRARVVAIAGSSEQDACGQIPFTPSAKKVLELALRVALSLGHSYVGTEHILLGLVRMNEDGAARILLDFDADSEKIRNEVIRMLAASAGKQDADTFQAPRSAVDRMLADMARNSGVPDLGTMSDGALDDLIGELLDRERAISYSRRILHGKIDILSAERKNRRKRDDD